MQVNPILTTTRNSGVALVSVIWLLVIGAAAFAATLRNVDVETLWPVAAAAAAPGVLTLILWPFLRREWAQIATIFVWIAFAIIASFTLAYFPMAILFLLAPAIAALFEREKVIEAMFLSAIFAAAVYFAREHNYGPGQLTDAAQSLWSTQTGLIGTIAAMLTAMFAVSHSRRTLSHESPGARVNLLKPYPGAALRFDARGRLRETTEAADRMFSLAPTDVSTLDVKDVFATNDAGAADLKAAFTQASESREETSVSLSAALEHDDAMSDLTLNFVPNGNGEVYMFAKRNTDLSERVNVLEASRIEAERDADDKTLFFAGVSHELRTPLNAIIGFSDMMRSRLFGPLPSKYGEYADLIHESGQHMLDLIGDVLDLSKIEAGKYDLLFGDFDAADVIRSSMKMLRPAADAAHVQMDADIADTDPLIIQADRKAFRQILLNLLSNAIKFTPKGGRVLVTAASEDGTLTLQVKDNGAGMSKEDLAKVGQPYTQTRTGQMSDSRGSGLGLSLVKSLVDLHHGQFKIQSKPGAGTTVDVALPVARQPD